MIRLSCLVLAMLTGVLAVAEAQGISKEDVTFKSGTLTLAGRLYLPPDRSRHTAVVFTHGSGPAGRDNARYDEEATFLATRGIASFLYDKRGVGKSGGNWQTATFDDLASDAIAAVRYLKTRHEINPAAIGLRGQSQSGWILPIAASRSRDVRFLVLLSPPGVTPYEQIVYDVRTDLEDAGFSSGDVDHGIRILRSGLDYSRSGRGWSIHKSQMDSAAGQRWLDIASGPPDSADWLWKWLKPVIDFDVMPTMANLRVPVLVLLGEQDREVPSQIAGYRIDKMLRPGLGSLVRYFPAGDHDLRSVTAPKVNGRAPFVDGFLDTMADWIAARSTRFIPNRTSQ